MERGYLFKIGLFMKWFVYLAGLLVDGRHEHDGKRGSFHQSLFLHLLVLFSYNDTDNRRKSKSSWSVNDCEKQYKD